MAIRSLPTVASVSATDAVAIASAALGCDAQVSLSILAAYLETLLTSPSGAQTIYWAPNATGQAKDSSPITAGSNVYLLVTPVADYAAGTITLPALATLKDGQTIRVSTTHAFTTLTVAGNGATVNGAPTTIAANGFFALRFDGVSSSWFRYA